MTRRGTGMGGSFVPVPSAVLPRKPDKRHAGCRAVLSARYSSTLRQVLEYSPQSTLARAARCCAAPGTGEPPLGHMPAVPSPGHAGQGNLLSAGGWQARRGLCFKIAVF